MDLSVIILSYNTADVTQQCLDHLVKSLNTVSLTSEIIVIDNASKDDSISMLKHFKDNLKSEKISLKVILNTDNVGYPAGNNQGIQMAKGTYILLLNSDALIQDVDFKSLLEYLDSNSTIGGLTVKLNLPKGGIDPASHRGFPTPWNAFCYFSKLEKIFGKLPIVGRLFGGYHLMYKGLSTIHEIDAPAGAFFLAKKSILERVHGFDEDYFFYGEDLDLAYKIKSLGYKIIYYPLYTTIHMKHQSGLKGKNKEVRSSSRVYFYKAMKIFYEKHYAKKYPTLLKSLVFYFIDFKMKHL